MGSFKILNSFDTIIQFIQILTILSVNEVNRRV